MKRVLLAASVAIFLIAGALIWRAEQPIRYAATPHRPTASLPSHATHPDAHVLFVGDVMLDRNVAAHARADGWDALFAGVMPLFRFEDSIVANLEGTITASSSVAIGDNLQFTFATSSASFLRSLGITAVSLSNNHADDFGSQGLVSTRAYLDNADIARFGSPDNQSDLSTKLDVEGSRVCLVGYEGFIRIDPAPIAAEIARLRPDCDYLVATMHAGEEYQATTTTALQRQAAHAFIDAGADAVIGTHPHVIEPMELYEGKPIFYSLGNFMFDQNFSWATMHGLAVEATLGAESTTYRLIPITIAYEDVSPADEADAERILNAVGVTSDTFEIPR